MAPRARTTSLVSSGSSSVNSAVLVFVVVGLVGGPDEDGADPHPSAMVPSPLGPQEQTVARHLGTRERHAAQLEGDQTTDGVDVEVLVELDVVQLGEILDRQSRGH